VIRDIHATVIREYAAEAQIRELPFTICAADTSVRFENLWVEIAE
jgi:hypothetical protein